MLTDIDEDAVKQQRTPEFDLLVWSFLNLVRDELNNDLDQAIENKRSGGQHT
jgi:hypothetical protein